MIMPLDKKRRSTRSNAITGTYKNGREEIKVLRDDVNPGRYKLIFMHLPYGQMVLSQTKGEVLKRVEDYERIDWTT